MLISRFYRGFSMYGTFRPGDQLLIENVDREKVRPGDVIIFRRNDNIEIVHRIVAVSPEGVVTQGDNNDDPDPELVKTENIIGIVTGIERLGKKFPLVNGRLGVFWSICVRVFSRIKHLTFFIGRSLYSWSRQRGWLALFWHPFLTKIQLQTQHGVLIKYIHKRRTVARWWPERHYFECRKPYDLVIPNPEKSKQN